VRQARFCSAQHNVQRDKARTRFGDLLKGVMQGHKQQEVTAKKDTPIPIAIPGETGKCAMALWKRVFEAEGLEGLERTQKELDVFLWSVEGKKAWTTLLYTPDLILPREKKKNLVLQSQLEAIGASQTFIDNLTAIFNSKYIFRLEQVRDDFFTLVRAFKREVDVRLITAAPLDEPTKEFMKNTIALNYLDPQDNIIFSTDVDPSIKGGYKVLIKGMLHDLTTNKAIEQEAAKHDQAIAEYISYVTTPREHLPQFAEEWAELDEVAKNPRKYRLLKLE